MDIVVLCLHGRFDFNVRITSPARVDTLKSASENGSSNRKAKYSPPECELIE